MTPDMDGERGVPIAVEHLDALSPIASGKARHRRCVELLRDAGMADDASQRSDLLPVAAALCDPVARLSISCSWPVVRRLDCWLVPDLAVFAVTRGDAATSSVSWVPARRSAGHAASFIDLGPRRVPGIDVAFELEPERLERLRECGGDATIDCVRAAIDRSDPAPTEAVELMASGLRTLKAWWSLTSGQPDASVTQVEILDTTDCGYWLALGTGVANTGETLLLTVRPRAVWRLLTSIFSEATLTGGAPAVRLA